MSTVKDRAGFIKHVAWLLEREEHLNLCYWAQDVAMTIGVIADVSNNEGMTLDVDELFITTSFKYNTNNEYKLLLKDLGIGTDDIRYIFLFVKRYLTRI